MEQFELEKGGPFGVEPTWTSLESMNRLQRTPSPEGNGASIHFYIEKIPPENRLRMIVKPSGLTNVLQLDNLSPDTALDWIYQILSQAESPGQQNSAPMPIPTVAARHGNSAPSASNAIPSLATSADSSVGPRYSLLHSISVRQFQSTVVNDVNLKANQPFALILGVQLRSEAGGSEFNASIYWVRIRVADRKSQNCVSVRDVAERWTFGLDKHELEIEMPGLDSGQFDLIVKVVCPADLKSEQQKLSINVLS